MTALTAKAALVDTAAFEGGGVIATSVPRSDIEEALASGTTSEFFLDLARERDGEREAEQRIIVTWEQDDLKKLLQSTTGDEVTFAFKPDELARAFEEPDVEAQGLRERMAVLTIAATTAAGISAGVASATVANPQGEAGSGETTAAFVTDTTSSGPQASTEAGTVSNLVTDTTSSGPQTTDTGGQFLTDATSSGPQESTEAGTVSNLVTDATSSGPRATEEAGTVSNIVTDTTSSAGSELEGLTPAQQLNALEAEAAGESGTVSNLVTDATSSGPRVAAETASASGGGGESFIESTGGQAALAGGLVLLLLGAGFVTARQRRGVQPA
jgi:hypothetical protein